MMHTWQLCQMPVMDQDHYDSVSHGRWLVTTRKDIQFIEMSTNPRIYSIPSCTSHSCSPTVRHPLDPFKKLPTDAHHLTIDRWIVLRRLAASSLCIHSICRKLAWRWTIALKFRHLPRVGLASIVDSVPPRHRCHSLLLMVTRMPG